MADETTGQAEALVNEPTHYALYNDEGRQIMVAAADAPYWLEHGFREDRIDLGDAQAHLVPLFDATRSAYDVLIQHAMTGTVDPTEGAQLATAHAALNELCEMLGLVERTIGALPVLQGTGVLMQRTVEDGAVESAYVDPGQVEMHTAEGWVTA